MSAQNTPSQNTTPIANEGCLSRLVGHRLTINVDGRLVCSAEIESDPHSENKLLQVLEELVAFMKAPKSEIKQL